MVCIRAGGRGRRSGVGQTSRNPRLPTSNTCGRSSASTASIATIRTRRPTTLRSWSAYERLRKGGASGEAIQPGDLENSYLWLSGEPRRRAPHAAQPGQDPGRKAQRVIKQWILGGGLKDSGSTTPRRPKPAVSFSVVAGATRPAGPPGSDARGAVAEADRRHSAGRGDYGHRFQPLGARWWRWRARSRSRAATPTSQAAAAFYPSLKAFPTY